MTTFAPADAAGVADVVASAAAGRQTLSIQAGGSKRALGRPVAADHVLDVSGLRGVVDYDPAELVLTARPATTMAEIADLLDAQNQMLAFEPPSWATLLRSGERPGGGRPTLGGTVACNLAGPRRVRAGAARDHLLGFSAVNGWGDVWKSGGRVVKNVTGYDMCKLQAGALGTLSVLTELSVRVLPRPEATCSVVVPGLDDAAAIVALARAMNAPHEVTAAAHLPAAAAARAGLRGPSTVLRLDGHRPSVSFRAGEMLAMFPGAALLEEAASVRLWQAVAEVHSLLPRSDGIVWRVCPVPSSAATVAAAIRTALPSAEGFHDWAGGLLWLSLDAAEHDAGAAVVRRAVSAAGGHATLVRAPDEVRARVAVFEPEPAPLAALTRRVKHGFDPHRVLNPGRMHEGI